MLSDFSGAELEPACGELLDSPDSGLEGAFFAPETPGVPKYEVPVRNSFVSLAGPPGKPTFVGAE